MSAQLTLPLARPRLKRQAELALNLLQARGSLGLSPREAEELGGIGRLAARVDELRTAYGEGAVMTRLEANGNGGRHARYYWRVGP